MNLRRYEEYRKTEYVYIFGKEGGGGLCRLRDDLCEFKAIRFLSKYK